MAMYQQIAFRLGTDWTINHTAFQSDNKTILDLTNCSMVMQFMDKNHNIVLPSSLVNWYPTSPLTQGLSTLIVTKANVAASGIVAGVYEYTVQVVLASGITSDLNYGPVTISRTPFSS